MNKEQVLQELVGKLRELDLDDGVVGIIAVKGRNETTTVQAFSTAHNSLMAIDYAQIVLDIASAIKHRVRSIV